MKYLIVGLGNIGAEYDKTRHNVGFDIINHLARGKDAEFEHKSLGDLAKIKYKGRTLLLLKPSTYVNRSGKAVRYWLQKEKIKQGNLLVIVDDLNLEFGKIRLRDKGSDGGHNGLKDINHTIGQNYARLRIGIGNKFVKGSQVYHVIGNWTEEEKNELCGIIKKCSEAALSFSTIGVNHTMNAFNK